jgi:hypothetical protein
VCGKIIRDNYVEGINRDASIIRNGGRNSSPFFNKNWSALGVRGWLDPRRRFRRIKIVGDGFLKFDDKSMLHPLFATPSRILGLLHD